MKAKSNSIKNLKHGIFLVFIANLINLGISLVNGFVLPKYLSVETYANIKTFQLYVNYIGILHLGYSDGLYLKYGGKTQESIANKDINVCRTNLLIFQGLISIIGLILSVITHNIILLATIISIIPINLAATYKSIFQATGEFKNYSKILNYTSILTFVGSMILLLVLKTDNGVYYIGWNVSVSFLIWFLMEKKLKVDYNYSIKFIFDFNNLFMNIKSGVVLMLGNFSSILMTSIDRWFIKVFLTIQDFALYSFVVSVENLIAIFITPLVTTMYNYICSVSNIESIKKIKKMCLLFSVFLISSAFPAKFILEIYLEKYLASKYVLFILFATEIFYMLIKGIYVNIYKARKQQKIYLIQLIVVVIIGIILNTVGYLISHSNESIAFATLASVIVWYIICCISVKELKPDWKENLLLIILVPVYILCGFFLSSIAGFATYIIFALLFSFLLMRENLIEVVNMIKKIVRKRIGVK